VQYKEAATDHLDGMIQLLVQTGRGSAGTDTLSKKAAKEIASLYEQWETLEISYEQDTEKKALAQYMQNTARTTQALINRQE